MSSFYGVRQGREIGVFTDWNSCLESVKKYSGAEYKKFKTEEEAIAYVKGDVKVVKNTSPSSQSEDKFKDLPLHDIMDKLEENEIVIYVDGSVKPDTLDTSFGLAYITKDKYGEEYKALYTKDDINNYNKHRNVTGEVMGAIRAIDIAEDLSKEKLYLYYDYAGIEHWATGEWKRKEPLTKMYHDFVLGCDVEIFFNKVKAHTGDFFNERVDLLAKRALNISK